MTTNTTFPPDIREKYELVKPLQGGPRFAFPAYGITVDFSKLDARTAEYLLRRNWPGIRRVVKTAKKSKPDPVQDDAAPATDAEKSHSV